MRRLMEQLFGRMPREFASPQRRVVEDFDRLCAMVDEHNKVADCFVSAYAFAGGDHSYDEVWIDKAIFDFDGTWGALVDTHEWLEERGVAHLVVFSGSEASGHLYVLAEHTRHQQSLEYFQRDVMVAEAGLRRCPCGGTVGRVDRSAVASWECRQCGNRRAEHETELVVDSNLIGDAATMIRVPNTWNPGAERFCVPLKPEEVVRDTDEVHELAAEQRDLTLSDVVCGDNTVDLTQHRETAEERYMAHGQKRRLAGFESDRAVLEEFEAEVTPVEVVDAMECTCLRRMFLDGDGNRTMPPLGHTERRILISHLVEEGYNPEEIAKFVRFAVAEDKARHSIVDEEQPVRIWRDGVRAPNKVSLKREGLFRQDCPVHAEAAVEVTE